MANANIVSSSNDTTSREERSSSGGNIGVHEETELVTIGISLQGGGDLKDGVGSPGRGSLSNKSNDDGLGA